MQFASRNILGIKYGWKQSELLFCNILEIAFLISINLLMIFLSLLFNLFHISPAIKQILSNIKISWTLIFIAGIAAVIFSLILIIKKSFLKRLMVILKGFVSFKFCLLSLKLFISYFILFSIMGLIFYFIILKFISMPLDLLSFFIVLTAFNSSWLLGFITPGSPGGLGVRESILMLMLSGVFGDAIVLMSALSMRVVTIFSDIAIFLIGLIVDKKVSKVL